MQNSKSGQPVARSYDRIARSLSISKGAVAKYLSLAGVVLGQLAKLRARLLASKPSDALGRFVQPGDRWHRAEPAAQVRVMQDFRDLCQMSIHHAVAAY